MTRRRSTLNRARRATRTATTLLGHARAVQTGRILPRVGNVLLGRLAGRLTPWLKP